MAQGSAIVFTRLADGTLLRRDVDGSFRPVRSQTDLEALSRLTDDRIEAMAPSDPDHPALDDDLWRATDRHGGGEPVKLDPDVVTFFRHNGGPNDAGRYEERINAVLRRYIETRKRVRS